MDQAAHRLPEQSRENAFVHPDARRGRGTVTNRAGRYERQRLTKADDGWDGLDKEPEVLRTQVLRDSTRGILARNQSPDIPFDRSINPYRGCEHGCVYCFARPTHAFLGLSAGLDFETKIFVKPDAADLLETELRKPGYRPQVIAMGTNTDPYQPLEKERKITRSILEVLARFQHPVSIVTKSILVTRDLDILAPMAAQGLVKVSLSITTLDHRLARSMEPRASTPGRRLEAIRQLKAAGIPAGVMFAPAIPGLNDQEMEAVLEASSDAGASEAGYVALRLPLEVKDLFQEWLAENTPHRAGRIMALIRSMNDGRDYHPAWGSRQVGRGAYADALSKRFSLAARRLRLNANSHALSTTKFRVPTDKRGCQLTLF
ncbi:MAG: PA0069 family radical SAM protein [Alphaproteobacteria bacterium]|nr:PA0069 family radical SAM protein [Alphaproteobacteria bacterium]